MKNNMNKKMEMFIRKLQEVSADLYEEYSQLDNEGITFCCPLTETIDTLYEFSIMNTEDTIDETKLYNEI